MFDGIVQGVVVQITKLSSAPNTPLPSAIGNLRSVSYTHLDVYKRQPINIPTIPNKAPPIIMANITYNVGKPTAPPRIRGPIILPSTCCRIRTKIENSLSLIHI